MLLPEFRQGRCTFEYAGRAVTLVRTLTLDHGDEVISYAVHVSGKEIDTYRLLGSAVWTRFCDGGWDTQTPYIVNGNMPSEALCEWVSVILRLYFSAANPTDYLM
jgi:hypothetical protein